MQKTPFSSWFSAHRAEKCKNRRFHRSFWGSPRFSVSLRKQNRNKHFFCNRDGTPSKKFAVPQKFHDEAQANNLPESHTDLRQTRRSRVARRRSCAPICHCCAPICHLPPEGRHVYRPRDGMFTARGAVSNESAGKSDEALGKSIATADKNEVVFPADTVFPQRPDKTHHYISYYI